MEGREQERPGRVPQARTGPDRPRGQCSARPAIGSITQPPGREKAINGHFAPSSKGYFSRRRTTR